MGNYASREITLISREKTLISRETRSFHVKPRYIHVNFTYGAHVNSHEALNIN